MELGFVYLMSEEYSNCTKLGISKDPYKRVKQLNSGTKLHSKITLLKTIETPYYKKFEKLLHRLFSKQNVRGEWFELPPKESAAFFILTPQHIADYYEQNNYKVITSLVDLIPGASTLFQSGRGDLKQAADIQTREQIKSLQQRCKKLERENTYLINKKLTATEQQATSRIRSALAMIPPAELAK